MKKKKPSPLWLIPAVVIVALILWCIHFPLTMFMGVNEETELSAATVTIFKIEEPNPIADITDPQQLEQIMETLNSVRVRFFGWSNIMNISAEKPTMELFIAGHNGETPFNIHLSVNGHNEVHIWNNNVSLRAKDATLYDYLTELLVSVEE